MELHYTNLKTVLITGGAGGIGSAIALELMNLGCVVLVIDNDAEGLKKLEGQSQGRQGKLVSYNFDLARTESLEAFFLSEIAPTYDRINALICCAGVHEDQEFFALDLVNWRKLYAINLESCFILCRQIVQNMAEKDLHGSVIFISSIHSYVIAGRPPYSSAKAALDMLSKELAYNCARFNIRVNTIAPGSIDTPLLRKALKSEVMRGKAAQRVPLGRLGKPEEVAYLTLFLLSDEAAYITGSGFVIDGGLLLRT